MTLISFNSVIFFMICLDKLSLGAVEPRVGIGDYNPKLSAEVKELKTTLASVQGSLITSVGLIQDQIDQFNKQLTSSVDSKLSVIEAKMIIFEDTLKRLDERSGGWDTVQHHVRTWGDQMTSLDSKVDHLGRSQMERLTTITGQVSSLQTSLGFNAERVSEQISSLEARLQRLITDSNPQIISSLQRLETKMASNRVRAKIPLHSSRFGVCNELKTDLVNLGDKIEATILSRQPLITPNTVDTTSADFDLGLNVRGLKSEMEEQLIKLFRRVALPFKKANRRLREMEDIGQQLESTMGEIRNQVQIATADINHKFGDFYNMSLEMLEHQHHQLQMSEQSMAGLKLCCSGTASDLSDFRAKTESMLSKLVLIGPNARNDAPIREQLRFNTDQIMSVLKQHEIVLIDGFDKCSAKRPMLGQSLETSTTSTTTTTTTTTKTTKTTTTTTTTTTATTTATTVIVTKTTADEATTAINAVLVVGQPEQVGHAEKMLQTCEQLLEAGFLDTKVYNTVEEDETFDVNNNDPGDFRQRFCDQTTSGGGWTVIQRRGGTEDEPKVKFTQTWEEYKAGFGDLFGEFWLGNDFIHKLTNNAGPMMLRIELEDFDNITVTAEYSTFRIESEDDDYTLWISGYHGNATDSFSAHNGSKFSTFDRVNDSAPKCCPCAPAYGGGWWFYSCFESNLNGEYHKNPEDNGYYRGIIWELWRGNYSLKSSRMMIRSASRLL